MLDEQDIDCVRTLSFAPSEGQSPLSLFQDKDAEYLSFPTLYCGERMNYRHYTIVIFVNGNCVVGPFCGELEGPLLHIVQREHYSCWDT